MEYLKFKLIEKTQQIFKLHSKIRKHKKDFQTFENF